jgi:hypothetical protein
MPRVLQVESQPQEDDHGKKAVTLKPGLRVTCYAADPFLISRELIPQGCDWPNKNLVSIPVKQPKVFQVLLSFPSSTRARGLFRSARVSKKFWSFAHWLKNGGVLRVSGRGGLNTIQYFMTQLTTRAEPLSFRAIKGFGTPQKDDNQDCTLIIVFSGCQLAKCSTAKSRPRLFRPTVHCEMAKSVIARKDMGSARVVLYAILTYES